MFVPIPRAARSDFNRRSRRSASSFVRAIMASRTLVRVSVALPGAAGELIEIERLTEDILRQSGSLQRQFRQAYFCLVAGIEEFLLVELCSMVTWSGSL